jgi:hypothetical protein
MPYIKNPLDDFSSYSIHYILVACRTTQTALNFANSSFKQATLEAIDAATYLGAPISVGGVNDDVYLVLDTRRFGQFTVESLKYDVYVNGLQAGAATSNLATDLSMQILDSVGISFGNFMQWLMDKQLQTNYDGMVFMLRTIFVGHHPDGSSETVQSETIPMHLNRMDINLDFGRGTYTLEFMPNMNFNVNRFGRFLTVSTATSYKSEDNKLSSAIKSLNDRLNAVSKEYYGAVQGVLNGTGSTKTTGRMVQYQITIPDAWNDMTFAGGVSGKAEERIRDAAQRAIDAKKAADEKAGKVATSYSAVPPGTSLTKALDLIFVQVPEIAKLGNFQQRDSIKEGSIKFYKHLVGITSDEETLTVHIDVYEFEVPNVFLHQKSTPTTVSEKEARWYKLVPDGTTGTEKRVPQNFIEYDYIFTGANKDILEFEMKVQDFQFLLASNLRMGDGALRVAADKTQSDDVKRAIEDLLYTRPKDPLLMPLDTDAVKMNFKKISDEMASGAKQLEQQQEAQRYTANLTKFYAGSPITVAMRIKGNPEILHKFNIDTLLDHRPAGDADGVLKYRADLDARIARLGFEGKGNGKFKMQESALSEASYIASPVFVRVKVMGPNVDFKTNTELDGDYATSVLTDCYYTVFKVSNEFTGHNFTQTLELYSHNIFGGNKIAAAGPATQGTPAKETK